MENSTAVQLFQMDGEVLVDSRIVAKGIKVEHESFMRTIYTYQSELEEFGKVRFQIGPSGKTNQPQKYAMLNRNQSGVAISFSRNTHEVVRFKVDLFKAIDMMEQQLLNRQDEMLALAGRLTDLEKRLHNLPLGLSAPQIDLADMTTTRIRQLIYEIRNIGEDLSRKRKVTPEQVKELMQLLHKLHKPMSELRDTIQQELDIETDLTFILFDYRGILETLAPEYKLITDPKPQIERISRPE